MASATQHRRTFPLAILLLATLVPMRAAAAAGGASKASCEGEKFPAGRSYAHCAALPYLGAALHWTYDAKAASLSVAFVAKPAGADGAGWVSWAINPTGDGMKGAQALVAFKGASSSAYVVNTYNVTGYRPLGSASTPIAFKATDLAADESGGEVRLYGKLQLRPGMQVVNHIWQVGSAVTSGAPAKHAFANENLEAKGKLVLAGGSLAPAPAPSPERAAGGQSAKSSGNGAPSGGKQSTAAAGTYVSAPVLMLLALAGFLAIV
ncbi:auxin-induced in root cultures protein 12-like [Phragmites australis]|uniref:auxin-induced in root cultures protein 12-like n=1 Tax=Phragmites australis TaxID=29695 RepID=UPI002D786171|nr:auxin-induced in root cultures protein 12-like [Phragmites australis]